MVLGSQLLFLAGLASCLAGSDAFFKSASPVALKPMPKNPALFQVNTRVVVGELSKQLNKQATLDDYPEEELAKIAEDYDMVYFLGVWQTGDFGMKKSIKLLNLDPCMKGLPKEAACSSPFAITDYSCHTDFGGDECLARLRDRVHAHGMRLVVDFVPNHMAVDHPWTKTKPELLVQGSENSLGREPQNFFKVGDKVFAHGKDMYYDGWEDTVQINYGNPAAREEMCNILKKIASLADGVRCDMAMLMCEDVLEKTWGQRLSPFGQERAKGQFWPPAIQGAKGVNSNFQFIAECYWDREYELQQQGFDFCYDKTLYDRLKLGDAGSVVGHLKADLNYQYKLVRFLENHDEERAADTWKHTDFHRASAVISFTIPGLRFIHDGQHIGRVRRVSMHVNRRDPEDKDVHDKGVKPMYDKLVAAIGHNEAIRDGEWRQCHVTPSQDQNPSFNRIIAHAAWKDQEIVLVVVNFCGEESTGHVILPSCLGGIVHGKNCKLEDLMGGESLDKEGGKLMGEHGGLWFKLHPWESHIYKVSCV
uniref:Glycosyl hydrolase family 13 catalytic domain-containing protein n=1 Tax=Hemiselmis andersenii TaxID=464988 RepID=A0A6T8GFN1_HEMAN|mmetsp:Transcript_41688/g.97280  ORF Transcript_41688/g.97280 Transcript_41688/m.97280 type:complete len:534 (+) Transcript_41688:40-1641(+)